MRSLCLIIIFAFTFISWGRAQEMPSIKKDKNHGVVWSAGIFKSWLKDQYVGFHKVGDRVTPIFTEQYKMGFNIQSHYMYRPISWMGIGVHLGLGLDINSFTAAPLLLFGGSISLGNNHQFMIDIGWSDGKRRKISGSLRDQLLNKTYTEIPVIYDQTELNTGFFIGLGYRIF